MHIYSHIHTFKKKQRNPDTVMRDCNCRTPETEDKSMAMRSRSAWTTQQDFVQKTRQRWGEKEVHSKRELQSSEAFSGKLKTDTPFSLLMGH
jgi:predicted phage gp36 major capsid-like protein